MLFEMRAVLPGVILSYKGCLDHTIDIILCFFSYQNSCCRRGQAWCLQLVHAWRSYNQVLRSFMKVILKMYVLLCRAFIQRTTTTNEHHMWGTTRKSRRQTDKDNPNNNVKRVGTWSSWQWKRRRLSRQCDTVEGVPMTTIVKHD